MSSAEDATPSPVSTTPPLPTGSGGGSPCPACGFLNALGMRFCGNCGAALSVAPAPQLASEPKASPTNDVATPQNNVSSVAAAVAPPAAVAAPVSATPIAPRLPFSRPAFNVPTDAFARDRERDRLLTLSNVQRMRGQIGEAQNTLENVLALMDGAPPRDTAPVYEQLGDLLTSQSKWDEAQTAFGKAHELDPTRASAEKKYARMTLRIADELALKKLGLGDGGAGVAALAPAAPIAPRKAGLAMVSSMLLPGLGQFYNGDTGKGVLCMGIYVASLIFARLLPDSERLMAKFTYSLASKPPPGGAVAISPLLWLLLAVSFAVWAYSVVDAAMGAGKTVSPTDRPVVDKTGWEV